MRIHIKLLSIIIFCNSLFSQDIAFVGNSITASGYNLLVEALLKGYKTHNFGVPGISVAIDGFNYKNTKEFKEVMNMKPQHVVILLGSNDWKVFASQPAAYADVWRDEYEYLVRRFKLNSTVFCGTIPYHVNHSESIQPIKDMNKIIVRVANAHGFEVIDYNKALGWTPAYFKDDGLHPNGIGRQVMADAAIDVLQNYPSNTLAVETNEMAPESISITNYPNPFNPTTTIEYSIPSDCNIKIAIYDISGNTIKNIVNENKPKGNYSITWDGTDSSGNSVSNGTYIYQIKAGDLIQTRKMVLLK